MINNLLLLRVFLYAFFLEDFCESSRITNIDYRSDQFLYRHRTAQFYDGLDNVKDVIIRRGTIFDFRLFLDSKYNGEKVDVAFTFKTLVDQMVVILPSQNQYHWKIQETGKDNYIDVRVQIPGNAPVGEWRMAVALRDRFGVSGPPINLQTRIVILFNPWSNKDSVFMNDNRLLNEYIFNEIGVIFKTRHPGIPGYKWFYNQFKAGMLDAVLFVLNKAKLPAVQRGDVVEVSRALKLLVNDDGKRNRGVLKGQWKPPYDQYEGRKATAPTDWTGSAPILMQYYLSGGVPVAYGQCWVYSGVMTSIFRCLGIPARPVTTFQSGIDHDTDLRIDKHYDANGYYDYSRSDSLWNFHVWIQAWMSRSHDLGNNIYGQWQEIDATPQTVRQAVLQNGPAPTNAVRSGQIDKYYDSDVIFSEVNADMVIWRNNRVDDVKTDAVGTAVLTKAVGSDRMEDITRTYKPPEHTQAERDAYRRAVQVLQIPAPSIMYNARAKKKTVDVKIIADDVGKIGQPYKIIIFVKNTSLKPKKVTIGIKVTSIYYSGRDGNVILERQFKEIPLSSMKSKKFDFVLSPNEYIDKLEDFYINRIEAVVIASDGQLDHEEKFFTFTTPELHITAPKKVKVGETFVVKAHFKNPLNRKLSQCYFIVEGERIERKVVYLDDVAIDEEVAVELRIKSKFPRAETLVISFVSKELNDVRGSVDIEITGTHINPFGNINILHIDAKN